MQDVGREAFQLGTWEGREILMGLISTVMFHNTALPAALSREGGGKERSKKFNSLSFSLT